MRQIELSFVAEDRLGSKVIRWGTHSDFSHVDIIMPSGRRLGARHDHPVWNCDRLKAGVQIREPDYADFSRDERLIIPCTMAHYDVALRWLMLQVNKPYDITGLLASFLLNRPKGWRDEGQWWCSELAVCFVERVLAGIECLTPANRVSPNDCYLFCGAFASKHYAVC
jgi:hypothetical protein